MQSAALAIVLCQERTCRIDVRFSMRTSERIRRTCAITGPHMQPLPRDEAAQKAVDSGLKPLSQLILEARIDA